LFALFFCLPSWAGEIRVYKDGQGTINITNGWDAPAKSEKIGYKNSSPAEVQAFEAKQKQYEQQAEASRKARLEREAKQTERREALIESRKKAADRVEARDKKAIRKLEKIGAKQDYISEQQSESVDRVNRIRRGDD